MHVAGVDVTHLGAVRLTDAARVLYDSAVWSTQTSGRWLPHKWVSRGTAVGEQQAPLSSPSSQSELLDLPAKGTVGAIMRVLDGLKASKVWIGMDAYQRVAMEAAGGPMQGTAWAFPNQHLDNDIFRIALLRRAQALTFEDGAICQMPYADHGPKAGQKCDGLYAEGMTLLAVQVVPE